MSAVLVDERNPLMADRVDRLQALLRGMNGAANGAAQEPEPQAPPPPQPAGLDLAEIARAWRARQQQNASAAGAQQAPQGQAAPPPVQGPAQAFQQQGPQWRQNPDGSLIASGYVLEWHGFQGHSQTSVTLRRVADGASVFDGSFGVLQGHAIEGVWIPYEARHDVQQARASMLAQQRVYQQQGMGVIGPPGLPAPPPQGISTGKKVIGGILALGSLALGGYAAAKYFGGPDEEKNE